MSSWSQARHRQWSLQRNLSSGGENRGILGGCSSAEFMRSTTLRDCPPPKVQKSSSATGRHLKLIDYPYLEGFHVASDRFSNHCSYRLGLLDVGIMPGYPSPITPGRLTHTVNKITALGSEAAPATERGRTVGYLLYKSSIGRPAATVSALQTRVLGDAVPPSISPHPGELDTLSALQIAAWD